MLTMLANQYQAASAAWMTASLAYALHLFYLLVAIELPLSAMSYLFYKEGLADFLAALLIKLLAVLFFYVLIVQAPLWIPAILHSFTQAGAAIGGAPALDPSGVFDQGITVANAALQGINNASLFNAFLLIVIAGLAALLIVIAYAVMAAQLLVTLIESYIVIGGGALMLGFAGLRWSMIFTERYLGYVVSVGIKLFVLYLIIGLGQRLAPQFMTVLAGATQNGLPQPSVYFDIMGGALVFMIVGWQVPALAASMMMGSPSLTFGTAASTAAMMSAAMANAVARSLSTTASTARQTTDAVASAAKLTRAATAGITEARQGGASLTTAARTVAGDIRRAAGQQFKDSVMRGTGRESARHAAETAGSQAVRGWGQNTMLGNLANRVHANRVLAQQQPDSASKTPDPQTASVDTATRKATTPGSSTEKPAGSTSWQNTPIDRGAPDTENPPRPPPQKITPPPIPHDSGGHGSITIRFHLPE